MRVNKGKMYCLKKSLNFIEFFKSMSFTELLVNVTEFLNLVNRYCICERIVIMTRDTFVYENVGSYHWVCF